MDSALLATGLSLEICKRKAIAYTRNSLTWLEETADALDERYGKISPCSGNILCERQYRRHKAGCIGRTETFEVYSRALS